MSGTNRIPATAVLAIWMAAIVPGGCQGPERGTAEESGGPVREEAPALAPAGLPVSKPSARTAPAATTTAAPTTDTAPATVAAPTTATAAGAGEKPVATKQATPAVAAKLPAAAPTPVRVHVFVTGRVQGVSFRAYTHEHAEDLKLTGWVRNLPDKRVEAVIEGPPDAVEKLLEAIRKGSPMSNVTDVEVIKEPHKGEFSRFEVTY